MLIWLELGFRFSLFRDEISQPRRRIRQATLKSGVRGECLIFRTGCTATKEAIKTSLIFTCEINSVICLEVHHIPYGALRFSCALTWDYSSCLQFLPPQHRLNFISVCAECIARVSPSLATMAIGMPTKSKAKTRVKKDLLNGKTPRMTPDEKWLVRGNGV